MPSTQKKENMKSKILILALLGLLSFHADAQYLYLEFDADCMERMEYEVTGPNMRLDVAFRLPGQKGNVLLLEVDKREARYLFPAGTLSCLDYNLIEENRERINEGQIILFVVVKVAEQQFDYYKVKILSSLQSGDDSIRFIGKNTSFTYNYLPTAGTTDLSDTGSSSAIYYKQKEITGCPKKISFTQETTTQVDNKLITKTVEFSIAEHFGMVYSEQLLPFPYIGKEKRFLKFINGQPVEPFFEAWCAQQQMDEAHAGDGISVPAAKRINRQQTLPEELSNRLIQDQNSGLYLDLCSWTPATMKYNDIIVWEGKIFTSSAFSPEQLPITLLSTNQYLDKGCFIGLDLQSNIYIDLKTNKPYSGVCDQIIYVQGERKGWSPQQKTNAENCILKIDDEGYYIDANTLLPYTGICNRLEYRNGIIIRKIPVDSDNNTNGLLPNGDCAKKSTPAIHIVQANEDLPSLARKYGLSIAQLKQWNELSSEYLPPCSELKITAPPSIVSSNRDTYESLKTQNNDSEPGTYIVQAGDNLTSIAKKFQLSIEELQYLNKLNPKAIIKPGQQLWVRRSDDNLGVNGSGEAQTIQTYKSQTIEPQIESSNTTIEKDLNELIFLDNQDTLTASLVNTPNASENQEIPSPTQNFSNYSVKSGDTLWKISKNLGVKIEKLIEWNSLKSNSIQEGQQLRYIPPAP